MALCARFSKGCLLDSLEKVYSHTNSDLQRKANRAAWTNTGFTHTFLAETENGRTAWTRRYELFNYHNFVDEEEESSDIEGENTFAAIPDELDNINELGTQILSISDKFKESYNYYYL